MWQCPICQSPFNPLVEHTASWQCAKQHRFDVAKQGYVNLLPVQFKNSLDPGDNKAMVQSREAFLNAGFYAPLVQAIASDIQSHAALDSNSVVFDAGCGEGYYLRALQALLTQFDSDCHQASNDAGDIDIRFCGNDIAKNAVLRAARQNQVLQGNQTHVVASSFALPLQDESIDVLLQIFAPVSQAEVFRVLKPSGTWYQVVPNDNHLIEFKRHLYQSVNAHQPSPEDGLAVRELTVSYTISPNQIQREQLLSMTPYAHAANAEKRQRCIQDGSPLSIDFKIYVYQQSQMKEA